MLVKITNRCENMCPHCLDACTPEGHDMSQNDFDQVIKFILTIGSKIVQISGGEPTLHPRFEDYVDLAARLNTLVVVSSNGHNPHILKKVIDKHANVHAQITADPRYYKNADQVKAINRHPRTHIVEKVPDPIMPLGRAKNYPSTKRYASCINVYLATLQTRKPIQSVIQLLQANNKYCTPMIDCHAHLRAGESTHCTDLGYVTNPKNVLDTAPCKQCRLKTHLDIL